MKRIEIIDNCLVPSDVPGEMKTAFVGTVMDCDDEVAGNVVASGRAKRVPIGDDGKYEKPTIDTTPMDPVPVETKPAAKTDPK